MRLNAETIYGFTNSLLISRFDNPKPTPDFHLELWDLVTRPEPKIAIAAPRGHAKSTAITHSFGLASVLFRERDFVLIISDTEGQAVRFLGDIKRELQENQTLINTFGVKTFRRDTEKEIIVEFNDGKQFCIHAAGSGQSLRGIKWRNKRPNLIICDDLENDEIVMNEDRRLKFRTWFYNALLPAGSDNCIIRVVGTILHMDSMLERLMPPWGDRATESDGLRYWNDDKPETWLSIRYQAHNDDFSLMLWPEKFSKKRYTEIRADYIEQGFPEGYSQEYLNYPIDEENAFFQKGDVLELDNMDEHMEYYIGGDLAISEKESRAYSVFVVAGLTANNVLKVVDVRRFRGDSLEIIDEIFTLQQRYNPEAIFLEKENIARSLGPMLKREQLERGVFLSMGEDTLIIPTQDKVKRAQSIRARARAGGIQVDKEAHWYDVFITELLQFPRGVYKDQVDAFAMIGLGLDKMAAVPTRQDLEDEEYDDEVSEYLWQYDGRDSHTGY